MGFVKRAIFQNLRSLKVSKSQKQIMASWILPKNKRWGNFPAFVFWKNPGQHFFFEIFWPLTQKTKIWWHNVIMYQKDLKVALLKNHKNSHKLFSCFISLARNLYLKTPGQPSPSVNQPSTPTTHQQGAITVLSLSKSLIIWSTYLFQNKTCTSKLPNVKFVVKNSPYNFKL